MGGSVPPTERNHQSQTRIHYEARRVGVGVEGDSTGWFNRAVERAEVQAITPHDLRRTCASLAVSSGANVLAVSRMFGHTDPSGTLGIYADLFDSDLDAVAVNLDLKISAASKTGPKHPLTVAGRAA